MSRSTAHRPFPIRLGALAIRLTAVVGILFAQGCGSPDPKNNPQPDSNTGLKSNCDEMLDSSLSMLQPANLGISSDVDQAVGLLNNWLETCGPADTSALELDPAAQKLLEQRVSPGALEQITARRFTGRDGKHIRDCRMFKAIDEFVLTSAQSDLQRVVFLFDHVVRNVGLVNAADTPVLSPYEVMLLGMGTAEDRAWVFAELLRQLQIDTVILTARDQEGAAEDQPQRSNWLVGVLLNDSVYLFDTRLGWPVPSAKDMGKSATVNEPATLAELLQDSSPLARLANGDGNPYSIDPSGLKSLDVQVIGSNSLWAPRLQRLQTNLAGERSLVIYSSLTDDDETGTGLFTRVAGFGDGRWRDAKIGIWPYPGRQLQTYEQPTPQQTQTLQNQLQPLDAPVEVSFDPRRQLQIGNAQRDLMKARTAQLLGKDTIAIKRFMTIRVVLKQMSLLPLPQTTRVIHDRGAEYASYWTGVSQMAQGSVSAAAKTFRDYLKRYPAGLSKNHARGLLAFCLAEEADLAAAVSVLEAADQNIPQHDGNQLLIRRWKALAKAE